MALAQEAQVLTMMLSLPSAPYRLPVMFDVQTENWSYERNSVLGHQEEKPLLWAISSSGKTLVAKDGDRSELYLWTLESKLTTPSPESLASYRQAGLSASASGENSGRRSAAPDPYALQGNQTSAADEARAAFLRRYGLSQGPNMGASRGSQPTTDAFRNRYGINPSSGRPLPGQPTTPEAEMLQRRYGLTVPGGSTVTPGETRGSSLPVTKLSWEFEEGMEGWTAIRTSGAGTPWRSGIVYFSNVAVSGRSCYLRSPLVRFPVDKPFSFAVRMRVRTASGQNLRREAQFRVGSERASFDVTADGVWHDYRTPALLPRTRDSFIYFYPVGGQTTRGGESPTGSETVTIEVDYIRQSP